MYYKWYIMIELKFLKGLMLIKSAWNECDICHYWYFLNYSFTFQPNFCNNCHDLLRMSVNFSGIAVLNIKGSDYSCIISLISKNEAITLSQNADLNNKNCKYFIGYFIDNHKLIQIKKTRSCF